MLEVHNPTPRLTRLELQGFKSFANRTVFQFEPGITAIIGPNGSGKSNISDAVRWVLGEQSHNLLRSRKTEDVIFAGGQGKSALGLAEVAVTFDNSTGWLPIDFAEVTVTRRTTRGGDNQFFINGRKVRMKDVQHLTATLGQSYTVVGQGLVDAALSQRAEDRRGLFEHAADLAGLRMKAQEAQRNLNEAESNAARIGDLLTEAEPRLRTLERAAKQAKEWQGVHDRLRTVQQGHYRILLERALAAVNASQSDMTSWEEAVRSGGIKVESLTGSIAQARAGIEHARATLGQHLAHLQTTSDQTRRIAHERELAIERLSALQRRADDMVDTSNGLNQQATQAARESQKLESELDAGEDSIRAAQQALSALEQQAAAAMAERAGLERRSTEILSSSNQLDRRHADLSRRQALFQQQRESESAEIAHIASQVTERNQRTSNLETELVGFAHDEAQVDAGLAAIEARLNRLVSELESREIQRQTGQQQLSEIDQRLAKVVARLEALQSLQGSGAGLSSGSRTVLAAARHGTLSGVRGVVAELIEVPETYETAIEATLGGRLQDIVVEKWRDAEAAIALLKRDNAGRATFQPIDTVRGNGKPVDARLLDQPGVIGVAAALVQTTEDVAGVVDALLGRTLVVDDLGVARTVLQNLAPGWVAVTLAGEIARSGGSVTGGAATRDAGTLARERELRDLPGEIEATTAERAKCLVELAAVEDKIRSRAAEQLLLENQQTVQLATRNERSGHRDRIASWLHDLRQEQAEASRREQGIKAAIELTGASIEELRTEEAVIAAEQQRLEAERADLQNALQSNGSSGSDLEEPVRNAGREVAALEERLRADRRRHVALVAHRAALAEEMQVRGERAAALQGEMTAVQEQLTRLESEAAQLNDVHRRLQGDSQPLQEALRQLEATLDADERDLQLAHDALLTAERTRGEQGQSMERMRSELANIRQRIEDDLDLFDPEELLATTVEVDVSGDDAEREIQRLKERLRRVGYIGDEAVDEFQRESERHAFLTSQLADVQGASARLRTMLDELQETMQQRFESTFAQVAEVFSAQFTALFGGGHASLILVEGEDGAPAGVDIVAQPPGKRLQSLALLSGGERALTAAALLFAILQVNPSPFALLDEVDAALDEANIVRFRDQLRSLAQETQAIIITHNRGTIEVADTLYGVSMGENGVSQVTCCQGIETMDNQPAPITKGFRPVRIIPPDPWTHRVSRKGIIDVTRMRAVIATMPGGIS